MSFDLRAAHIAAFSSLTFAVGVAVFGGPDLFIWLGVYGFLAVMLYDESMQRAKMNKTGLKLLDERVQLLSMLGADAADVLDETGFVDFVKLQPHLIGNASLVDDLFAMSSVMAANPRAMLDPEFGARVVEKIAKAQAMWNAQKAQHAA